VGDNSKRKLGCGPPQGRELRFPVLGSITAKEIVMKKIVENTVPDLIEALALIVWSLQHEPKDARAHQERRLLLESILVCLKGGLPNERA
jgi:hypothetical protein